MKTENDAIKLKNAFNETGLPILGFIIYLISVGSLLCLLFDMTPEFDSMAEITMLGWLAISLSIGTIGGLFITLIDMFDDDEPIWFKTSNERIKWLYLLTVITAAIIFLIVMTIKLLIMNFGTIIDYWQIFILIPGLAWVGIATYNKFKHGD